MMIVSLQQLGQLLKDYPIIVQGKRLLLGCITDLEIIRDYEAFEKILELYIKSEKQLLDLKIALKTQSLISAYVTFILRSFFRFLPSNLLGFVYNNLLRKKP